MGFYTLMGKNAVQRKFGALVTNSFFVIIVTLIITFYIWIVKCCHSCPSVILSKEHPPAPLPALASLPVNTRLAISYQLASKYQACQFLPGCESFNKPLLPTGNTHTSRQHAQHTGRKGSQYNDCYYNNSLYYKIDIYIYWLFFFLLFGGGH